VFFKFFMGLQNYHPRKCIQSLLIKIRLVFHRLMLLTPSVEPMGHTLKTLAQISPLYVIGHIL
jgi:hypothetical protein